MNRLGGTVAALIGCLACAPGCAVGVGYSVPISGGRGERVERPPPPPPDEEVAGVIVPGKSTREDVLALMGPPATQHQDEQGFMVWTYWSNEAASGSYAHQAIRIVFDPSGTVSRVDQHRAAP